MLFKYKSNKMKTMNDKKQTQYIPGINCDSLDGVALIDALFEEKITKKKIVDRKIAEMYDTIEVVVPKIGDRVSGKYYGKVAGEHLLNIGFKDLLRVDEKPAENKYFNNFEIGDMVEAIVTDYNESPFELKGSIATIYEIVARESMLAAIDQNIHVDALVKDISPAGFSLEFQMNGVTFSGFMPNTLSGINRLKDPSSLVGKTLEVMAESFSPEKGTYILSRKKYLKTLIAKELQNIDKTKVYTGSVTGTTDYGVFVEFKGCLTGMIHKANINPIYADKLGEIQSGTPIDFYVKEVLKDKIILTQIIRETLWDTIEENQVLEGVVKDMKIFGALVQLDDETRGLIHTNELKKLNIIELKPGQKVKVKVTDINRGDRKIYLTIV